MTQHYTDSHKNETVQHRVTQTHTKQYSTTQHCTGTQKKQYGIVHSVHPTYQIIIHPTLESGPWATLLI